MRRGIPVSKNNASGMTLVEVLVAMAIVFIIFLGMSSGGIVVLNENIKNDLRDEAVSVAEMEMQRVRSIPFADVDNNSRIEPRQIRGLNMNFTVNRTVLDLNAQNKQVTANVSWTRWENNAQKSYSHQVMTIVRPN
jgi:prepilin-type N-terminal cleavage/methylation domain-containing protein